MRNLSLCLMAGMLSLFGGSIAQADTRPVAIVRAEGPTLTKATGHYARARSLLIAAIREFDKATQLVDPDALLDSEEWRSSLLDRSEELQKILSPQPRASASGVRYEPDTRLLGEAAGR